MAQDRYGRWATNTVAVTVNASNNAYAYDLNDNLLTDGTRQFVWDDENQLISVYVTNVWREDFVYDGKLRRRITRQYTWNGSWQLTKEVHDVYAGNVVVQERDQNNLPQVSYTRGNDLSGTLAGAGGIGGLLARTDNAKLNLSDPFATTVYHADGNGNVTALIYTNATMAAKYLYDPYGNTLAESGPLAEANAYRFSSKEWDENAGLYYYLYRFYDPNLQRWPNRDPNQEWWWWINLYAFDENDPVDFIDPEGAKPTTQPSGDPCATEAKDAKDASAEALLACAAACEAPESIVAPGACIYYTIKWEKAQKALEDCRKAHQPQPKPPNPKPSPPKK